MLKERSVNGRDRKRFMINRKHILGIEFTLIFILTPVLYTVGCIPLPRLLLLALMVAYGVIQLVRDRGTTRATVPGSFTRSLQALPGILIRLAIAIGPLVFFSFCVSGFSLHLMPFKEPVRWFTFLLLYPVASAFPQEILFRLFFFRRYERFFPRPLLMIVASAGVFAWMHVVYQNWIAVLLSFFAGIIFSSTYARTGSLIITGIEHTLYGWAVFTVGLGMYFS